MAVVFVNRYFHPDHSATSQLLSDLAFEMGKRAGESRSEAGAPPGRGSSRGPAVQVLTSRLVYDNPAAMLPAREIIDGVGINRIWTSRFGRDRLAGRTIDYLTFYLSAFIMLLRVVRRGDVVVAMTDPPMISLVAAPVAWLKGARLVNWLQDVFPELAEASGLGTGLAGRSLFPALRWLRNRSLKAAAMTVVLGDVMAERIERAGVARQHIRVIANWSDGDVVHPVPAAGNALRRDWGLQKAFVVGYSGNLGRVHDFATILAAAELVERDQMRRDLPIVWLFVGGGALYVKAQQEAARRGLTSVQFRPYQPRARLAESLSAADIHLVSLRPEFEGLVVPSKYYGILAAARPIVFIGAPDGEIARNVARNHTGITIAQGDGAGLRDAVVALAADPVRVERLGMAARAVFERDFAAPISIGRWIEVLQEVG